MPGATASDGQAFDCEPCNSKNLADNCAPITIPKDDKYFPSKNKDGNDTCMRFTRALNVQKRLGVREQVNQNSHFLDLSTVYGSEICEAASVRTFKNGELLESKPKGFILPPQDKQDVLGICQSKPEALCFTCGDFRNALHPGLVPLHTMFIREHNALARQIQQQKPRWSDEKVFHETRRIVIAEYQHMVYAEYLPKLVGEKVMAEFGLTPKSNGFTQYNAAKSAAIYADFAAAAFRFGHSQVRKDFPRVNNRNETVDSLVDLGSNIFYSDSMYGKSGTEGFMEGMMQQAGLKVDNEVSFPMRNQMFELRNKKASGVDLIAVNIARGRDCGLFPYNDYRFLVGLKRARDFDGLKDTFSTQAINAFKKVYDSVDDIDLYSAILYETPTDGALLGRTGSYMIAQQFQDLKDADRFYYEHRIRNSRGFTAKELRQIRRTSLSRVVCDNLDNMTKVHSNPFDMRSEKVQCRKLRATNVNAFVESGDKFPAFSSKGTLN